MNKSNPKQSNNSSPAQGGQSLQKKGPKSKRQNKKSDGRSPMSKGVSVPVAQGKVNKSGKAKIERSNNEEIVISHREYLGDIAGSINFATTSYQINPGQPISFPWLSNIAAQYESYRFEKLEYFFETQAATTATGTIVLAVDYDSNDATPLNKQQAMAYANSVRSPPWSSCCHSSSKLDLNKQKSYYVAKGSLASNQDINLYATGYIYICVQGQAGTTAIGELYVDYRVRLMTPQLANPAIGLSFYSAFSGTSNAAPFATKTGNVPATVSSSGTTTSISTWTFSQAWEGYVTIVLVGTGFSTGMFAPTGTATSVENGEAAPAAGTNAVASYSVTAAPAQTFILTISDTTITSSSAFFGQGDV